MDGRSESLIKITAVEDRCVGSAAYLTRRFVVAVFGDVSFLQTMKTKSAF